MVSYVVPGATGMKEHGNGFSPNEHALPLLVNNDAPAGGQAQSPRPLGARDGVNKKVQQLRNRPAPATQSMGRGDLERMSREELARYAAQVAVKYIPEMVDVCPGCSVEGFNAMRVLVSPVTAVEYDPRLKPDTLAAYDGNTNTAFLFDQYFKSYFVLQVSTLFHEYLHSFPANKLLVSNAKEQDGKADHVDRVWEEDPLRLEKLFQKRFGQRIMSGLSQ